MTALLNPPYRQSIISRWNVCSLSTLFSLLDTRRTPGQAASGGTLVHRALHQAQRIMWEHGEPVMSVEQMMEIYLEVLCQRDVPSEEVVPITMKQMQIGRMALTRWCEDVRIEPSRIVGIEFRMFADLTLPTGEVIPITGQTDVVFADSSKRLIIGDYKSGQGRPKQPRDEAKAEGDGRGLTELGWVQWLVYSLLAFNTFPTVDSVTFREWHLLWGEMRQAKMERWQLERFQDVLIAQVALLHQAIQEGPESPRWIPSAGPHCSLCARPRDCPIRDVEGIPTNQREAQRLAQEWIVAGVIRSERRKFLDGWVDAHGPIEVPHAHGRRVVGWDYSPEGKRNFRVFEPREAPVSPYDDVLVEAAKEAGVLTE